MSKTSLKNNSQAELDFSGRVYSAGRDSESWCPQCPTRNREGVLVKDVEEFRSELNLKSLGDLGVFDNGEISIAKIVSAKRIATQGARVSLRYRAVGAGNRSDSEEFLSKVESVVDHVSREELLVRSLSFGLIGRILDQVGTSPCSAVVIAETKPSGSVGGIHCEGKAGLG